MNFFEQSLKGYDPQWKEISTREFTDAEIEFMGKITVHQGNYDRSIKFTGKNGKTYFIPIEKSSVAKYSSEMVPGATLDAHRMIMVQLSYIGSDPKYKVRETFKIRYKDDTTVESVTDFNDPFGLNKG